LSSEPLTADTREVILPPEQSTAGAARSLLEDWFGRMLAPFVLETAKLLVSELVTNALVHGKGQVTLRAVLGGGELFVEVIDEGDGFELPEIDHEAYHDGGWGLRIVATEATRWGVFEGGPTQIWFVLDLGGVRRAVGAPGA
jgi:anti-sigma regulatory factor (Ser/Thr protein kinase)